MSEPMPFGPADADPTLWDTVIIGDVPFPGLATVEVERGNKRDDKTAKGQHGSDDEYSGAENATVRIRLRYLTQADDDDFDRNCLPIIEPNPEKKKVEAKSISHPAAAKRKVSHIKIDNVSGPVITNGVYEWSIDATESRPPSPKNATGSMKSGGPAKGSTCQQLNLYRDGQRELEIRKMSEAEVIYQELGQLATDLVSAGATAPVIAGAESAIAERRAHARQLEAEAAVHRSSAQMAELQMQALGCFESKPSGNPATTQPTT